MSIVIQVTAKGAKHLKSVTTLSNQDPFCILYLVATAIKKTKTHTDGNSKAVWEERFDFEVKDIENDTLNYCVYDDNFGKDALIGKGSLSVANIHNFPVNTNITDWYNIQNKDGEDMGEVELEIKWQNMVEIYVKANGAKKLRSTETFTKQDPYLKLFINPKPIHKTHVHENGGSEAEWGESFTFRDIIDPSTATLYMEVMNKNSLSDKLIGKNSVQITNLLCNPMNEVVNVAYTLDDDDGKEAGELSLDICWHLTAAGEAARIAVLAENEAEKQAEIDAAVAESQALMAAEAAQAAEEARVAMEALELEKAAAEEAAVEAARVAAEAEAAAAEAESARIQAEAEAARVAAESEAEAEAARVAAESDAEAEAARVAAEAEAEAQPASEAEEEESESESEEEHHEDVPEKKKKKKKKGLGGALRRLGRSLR